MRANALRITLLVLLLAGVGIGLWQRHLLSVENLNAAAAWFEAKGAWGAALYLLVYSVGPVFGLPALPLTFLGGILFGPIWGAIFAIIGATIADSLGFLLARYLARDLIERRLTGSVARVKAGVEAEGWRFIAFLRLTPVFPFWMVSYTMGITRISFWVYALTTFLCIIPAASAYAYLGYAGRQALLAGQVRMIVIALGVTAAVAFLPLFAKRLRRKERPAEAQQL